MGLLDEDLVPDLVVGDADGNELIVLFLRATGKVKSFQKIGASGVGGLTAEFPESDQGFGKAIATLGDLDTNGIVDIAVSAPAGTSGAAEKVYVLFLTLQGRVKSHRRIGWNDGGFTGVVGLSANYNLGRSLAAVSDVNSDGTSDLVGICFDLACFCMRVFFTVSLNEDPIMRRAVCLGGQYE